ncbi:hypothetical protein C8R43DRAFT_946756 [Mycena crocata]|nr:hypothetical protein C8R43DRAFT_946756 [Mycena crocata]
MFTVHLIGALLSLSSVHARCGDNGVPNLSATPQELGWGAQADTDSNGGDPRTVLGFSSSGPFDAAGTTVVGVIATDAGWDPSYYAFSAFLYGQSNPQLVPADNIWVLGWLDQYVLLVDDAQTGYQRDVERCPVPHDFRAQGSQRHRFAGALSTFEWIGTEYITYSFVFLSNQSGTPLDPGASTDYTSTIVAATNTSAAYLRLDYTPGGLPPSTGLETGLVLALSDD